MSRCLNVLLKGMRNNVLFKIVILESMQSICAVDGNQELRRVKPFKFPPKILSFCIETTPLHFLKLVVLHALIQTSPHRSHLATASYFRTDWSYQTKVPVGWRGCSKVGNVTLKNLYSFNMF